jgi:glycosyltransferase involved in cell wall biosynthesis
VFFHGFEIRSQLTNGYPAAQRDIIAQRTLTTLRERTFAVVGLADEILVNSSYTASIFEGFEIHPPVHVVGCGIELETAPMSFFNGEVYDAEQREQRRRVLNLPGERTLGYVGRLIAAKRIDRMLQFCAADERLGAVIVGTGNELAALQAQSKALGLEQRVVFAGKVSEAQKWQILSAIDALCLLSEPDDRTGQVEGFGISALEGVAAGALPVSSGTGGMGDFVIDDETGLVLPPGDDEGAGRKLREMLWSGERVNALVEAARQTIRDRFNYAEIARKLAERWDGAALADDSSAGIFVEATIAETVTVDGEQAAQ